MFAIPGKDTKPELVVRAVVPGAMLDVHMLFRTRRVGPWDPAE
jgi:hypothetical protein